MANEHLKLFRIKKARERSLRNGGDDAMAVEAEAASGHIGINGGACIAQGRASGQLGACDTAPQPEAG